MSAKEGVQDKEQEKETMAQEELEQEQEAAVNQANEDSTEEGNEPSLEDRISELEEALAAEKDQKLRLYADFENHRKRTAKERVELFGSANQELMSALLPVLDDFKRALGNMEGQAAEEGIRLIFNKFENTLKQKGLKPMESTVGKAFDVDTMEAITRIPAPTEDMKGKVIDEIEQGFELGNKIIRYARVVVGE